MRFGEGFRSGYLSTKSEYSPHILVRLSADLCREYSISEIRHDCRPALLPCMVSCTSPMELKQQGQCGRPGRSQWNGTAATSNEAPCEAGNIHWRALTTGSSKQPSWRW